MNAKKMRKIDKQARKHAQNVYQKYSKGDVPFHEILEKMTRLKNKNNWSDAEFEHFRAKLAQYLTGDKAREIDYNQNIMALRSRISKVLGGVQCRAEPELQLKETEHGVLAEILQLYEKTLTLHRTIFMHSLLYDDCSIAAMTGEFRRERHIGNNHIHPLLACMFLPKFEILETYMIYSNFGEIVKSRYEKKPIVTEPNVILLQAITTDPNDVVCEIKSPLTDLKNRFEVQISLWETILNLRNGRYYDNSPTSEFLTILNKCRNNLYDNADLAYNQDEGAILRKILSVFSMRPTIITTKPIYSIASFVAGQSPNYGGDIQSVFPFNAQPFYTLTSIPMISMQLPPVISEYNEPRDLRTAIRQTIWINENKMIIPKEQAIIHSDEILIFYVNRRDHRIQIRTYTNPIPFSQLPITMSGFDRLNKYPLNIPPTVSFGNGDTFDLRSVVAVTDSIITQADKSTNIITGCTGLIQKNRDTDGGIYDEIHYLYDPLGASIPIKHPQPERADTPYFTNKPVSWLPANFPIQPSEENNWQETLSFADRCSQNGTIFIYAKPGGYNRNDIISI